LLQNLRNKNTNAVFSNANTNAINVPVGRWMLLVQFQMVSGVVTQPTLTITNGSAVSMFDTAPSTGISADSAYCAPSSGSTNGNWLWAYGIQITSTGGSVSFGTCTIGAINNYDVFLLPYPAVYSLSRKAVDWDPIAILTRKLEQMESRLAIIHEGEDEKYCDSECSTPLHVEPDVTQSTSDLAESLLSRLAYRRGAVTQKTALPHAA